MDGTRTMNRDVNALKSLNRDDELLLVYIATSDANRILNIMIYLVFKHLEAQNMGRSDYFKFCNDTGTSKNHDLCKTIILSVNMLANFCPRLENQEYDYDLAEVNSYDDRVKLTNFLNRMFYYLIGRLGIPMQDIDTKLNAIFFDPESFDVKIDRVNKHVDDYLIYLNTLEN